MPKSRNAELVFGLSRSTTILPGSSFTGSTLGNWKLALVWTLRWIITTSAKSFRGTLIERGVVRENSVAAVGDAAGVADTSYFLNLPSFAILDALANSIY